MGLLDFGNPVTWVWVFLFIFLGILVYAKVPGLITGALDRRADAIKDELDEARKLREEAQSVLADYQRKAREAEEEAEGIVAQAKRESEAYAKEAREKLEETLERRSKAADLKIQQAEAQAINEVRTAAVEAAIEASERLITDKMSKNGIGDKLIDTNIDELKTRLN